MDLLIRQNTDTTQGRWQEKGEEEQTQHEQYTA